MAPFNTHFLVAEQIWSEFVPPHHYGQFCFGCVAPDVDKISVSLTQKETHFFDRSDGYEWMVTHRSITFLQQQATFLAQPFNELSAEAQAFALGYLCHLCVDEVTKHLWRPEKYEHIQDASITSLFAALDEWAKQQIQDHDQIKMAIQTRQSLPHVIPMVSAAEWVYYALAINQFVIAPNTEAEYLALVDYFGRADEVKRAQRLARFRLEIDPARSYLLEFYMPQLITASVTHSRHRLTDLIQGSQPIAAYPF